MRLVAGLLHQALSLCPDTCGAGVYSWSFKSFFESSISSKADLGNGWVFFIFFPVSFYKNNEYIYLLNMFFVAVFYYSNQYMFIYLKIRRKMCPLIMRERYSRSLWLNQVGKISKIHKNII